MTAKPRKPQRTQRQATNVLKCFPNISSPISIIIRFERRGFGLGTP